MAVIKTEKLTKYYGRSRGIVELSLSVEEGEIFGFIGPNGAGKSTTIRILLGLIFPTSGTAEILGKSIDSAKTELLSHIGYLSSEGLFYSGMSVAETIRYSARLHRKDCSKQAKLLCERLKLDTKRKVEELSLGNRKKVSIVCALQHNPELYILDEPTSGLDPLMQREFFSLLEERNREGATVFLSSHVLSEIQNHCHKAGIIKEGKLIACAPVADFSKTAAKRIGLSGVGAPPSLEGVADIHGEADSVSFLYQGDLNPLLKALQEMPLRDLTITEPSLDEIFLHFYSEGGEQK